MSSIIEDELNMVFEFANETPSIEQLAEYTDWKLVDRSQLLEVIKDMDRDNRMQVCYEHYATTIEYENSKKVVHALDQMLLNKHSVFFRELEHVIGLIRTADNPSYPMWREATLHESYNARMIELKDYISFIVSCRMPILSDIRWIISSPDLKQAVMKRVAK